MNVLTRAYLAGRKRHPRSVANTFLIRHRFAVTAGTISSSPSPAPSVDRDFHDHVALQTL